MGADTRIEGFSFARRQDITDTLGRLKMRIMALDYGTKRIGVAMSDELMMTAQGMETIERSDPAKDIEIIRSLAERNGVAEIVVGLPLNMNGTYSEKTKEAVAFAETVRRAVAVPVNTWDERLTTAEVERVMLSADVSRAKRRRASDRLAAQVILQSYLDSRKKG
jgi:putative Holliday junction resolvase